MKNELWKPVKGYEGLYEVSSLGRVRNNKNKILKQFQFQNGYYGITLHKNGVQKTLLVHRLVAETLLQNPDNLSYINHKNEDKTDNRVENLEWCTQKYNCNYGSHNLKLSKSLKNRPFSNDWKNKLRNASLRRERDGYGRFI